MTALGEILNSSMSKAKKKKEINKKDNEISSKKKKKKEKEGNKKKNDYFGVYSVCDVRRIYIQSPCDNNSIRVTMCSLESQHGGLYTTLIPI